MTDKKGDVVLVTGAGAGLGRAIARRFAAGGARLVLCDVNGDRVDAVGEEIRQQGVEVVTDVVDVSDVEGVTSSVEGAVEVFGSVDVLVNNAGIMDKDRGVGELDLDDWSRVLAINLTGPMLLMRAVIPHMRRARSGQVLNIASTAALRGGAAGAAYTAAKHGLIGLSRSTAWLYADEGIRCNVIAPGGMNTEIAVLEQEGEPSVTGKALAKVREIIPGTLEPEMVANAVFRAVELGRGGMNGAVIPVDVGWSAG